MLLYPVISGCDAWLGTCAAQTLDGTPLHYYLSGPSGVTYSKEGTCHSSKTYSRHWDVLDSRALCCGATRDREQ